MILLYFIGADWLAAHVIIAIIFLLIVITFIHSKENSASTLPLTLL